MKKVGILLTVLFLILIVPVLVCADMVSILEIRQQAAEMGRWTKTYESHGRRIEVDIPIIIPEVNEFPLLKAEFAAPFTPEVLTVIETLPVDKMDSRYHVYTFDGSEGEGAKAGDTIKLLFHSRKEGAPNSAEGAYACSVVFNEELMNDAMLKGSGSVSHQRMPWDLEDNMAYAEDNPMTYREAVEIAERLTEWVYPQTSTGIAVRLVVLTDRRRTLQGTGKLIAESLPGQYELRLGQTFHQIPLLTKIDYSAAQGQLVYLEDRKYAANGQVMMRIYNDRAMYFDTAGLSLLSERETVLSDMPLTSLPEIITAIEEEIMAGHIRRIYSLELGYTAYRDDKDDSFAWLYPTWLLRCNYFEDAGAEQDMKMMLGDYIGGCREYRDVYIPAQGTQLKHWNKLKNDKDEPGDFYACPPIVTWEEVK